MNFNQIAEKLLKSENPSIRWKIRINYFDEDPESKELKRISNEIKTSNTVKSLLQNLQKNGEIVSKNNIYDKWQGAHWILASLADIGYPPGDSSLDTIKDKILETWLSPYYYNEFEAKTKEEAYKFNGVPLINGRYRRCASQQGNALFYLIKLGLVDDKIHNLAERLMLWQWPDGGWNCDKNPTADTSSFMETALPMRGLFEYSRFFNKKEARESAMMASEVFLERKLYKRKSTGEIINKEFTLLHYPLYWHYDILGILKILSEMNLVKDNRCEDALNLLISKYIKDEGWPAEKKYYKPSNELKHGNDYVDWGPVSKKKQMNG